MKYSEIKMLAEEVGPVVHGLIDKATAPLMTRISVLEAEVKAGHERIKALEARHD